MSGPVYLSFSREHDAAYVSRLAARLAAAGITARYDTQPMGESWWETFTRAQIESCHAVIAVVSPEALASGWVARELDYARSQGKPVLAIDVGEAPGPDLLDRLRPAPPGVAAHQGKMSFAVGIETRGGAFRLLAKDGAGQAIPVTLS